MTQPDQEQPVVLIDEAGRQRSFRVHDAFDLEGRSYYLVEAADDPEQVMFLKETDGTLETVDPDELQSLLAFLEKDDSQDSE
ncbi:MAG: DUF1292 domain-containing protein [Candidatus Dormibacteraeota bacterium]|uniref:DUF1292 domain-containing protein n=1 Tax=Candidatus Dormiibacter inghamiae TaxID=3127013 RepID=A0A934NDU4_9BACT|nr:DUF1292 domain-containing protein [Candidatus Dormibacteraeota bacterium]MBJ7607490.1 DUF1292 domain-containing protein [Candidatus Dormibacteraeota bacterium]